MEYEYFKRSNLEPNDVINEKSWVKMISFFVHHEFLNERNWEKSEMRIVNLTFNATSRHEA